MAEPLRRRAVGLALAGLALAGLAATGLGLAGQTAGAQEKKAPRIVCWFDKAGKVQLGCGNVVPPEYLGNPTRELTRQGITVTRPETPTAGELRARQEEEARRKAELARITEQQRRDRALLDSYTDVREIDARRDRDLAQLELTVRSLQTSLKQVQARQAEIAARAEGFEKQKREVPPSLRDELARASDEIANVTRMIEDRHKEIEASRVRYDELRARYLELRAAQAQVPSGAVSQPAPAAPVKR